MKVLIVDDEPDVRRLAQLCLEQLGGMEVIEASSAAEGLRRAEAEHPDVVLLDLMMPRVDGRAALASLRENPASASIPVVFLTARSGEDRQALLKAGARGLLAKPFDPTTLAAQLRAILGV